MDASAFDPIRLRQRLLDHGVDLNPGLARCPDWMPPPMRAIHGSFDGFAGWDCESYIEMWSAQEIEDRRAGFLDRIGPDALVIGDYLMQSDLVVVDGGALCRPVRLFCEDRCLAPTYELFWDALLSEGPSW